MGRGEGTIEEKREGGKKKTMQVGKTEKGGKKRRGGKKKKRGCKECAWNPCLVE